LDGFAAYPAAATDMTGNTFGSPAVTPEKSTVLVVDDDA
jgi:hypothetical protein